MSYLDRLGLALCTSLPLAGCIAIEQAPLVYSSKQTIGVGVTAGTPENPGLDVTIGYKGLDAAFVPVAVAKKCPASTNCENVDYGIRVVTGENKTNGQLTPDEKAIASLQNTIIEVDEVIAQNTQIIKLKEEQLADIGELTSKIARRDAIDPAKHPDRMFSDTDREEFPKLSAEIAALDALDKSIIAADITNLRNENDVRAREQHAAMGRLRVLEATSGQMPADDKLDAFSVYGSFNGNATGGTKGAGLSLGKVFSTGIAAQNVSQGVRNSAPALAAANCISAAQAIALDADEQDRALIRELGLRACGVHWAKDAPIE